MCIMICNRSTKIFETCGFGKKFGQRLCEINILPIILTIQQITNQLVALCIYAWLVNMMNRAF